MRVLPLLVLIFFAVACHSKVVHDKIKEDTDFVFLSKFCYDTRGLGDLFYSVTSHVSNNKALMLFYDDESISWMSVYKSSLTCEEKVSRAKGNHTLENGKMYDLKLNDMQRPHFWYFAAASCGQNIDLEYNMTMLNYGNDTWTRHFSFDEQGLEGLYLFYFIFFIIGCLVHAWAVWVLVKSNSYHSVVRLLTVSVVLEFLSVFFLFVHYAVYATNGFGAPGLLGMGELLDIAAQIVFILLLVLIAKGWCITKLQIDDKKVVLIGLTLLSVAYIVMFIWENVGRDPASTLYIYESPPGIIILVIRGAALGWFLWSLRSTYMEENHPTKREFYVWFGVAYALWLLTLPVITSIAAVLAPWVRQKTVMILYVTSNALGMAGLGFLLWPSRAGEYFQISSRMDLAGTIPYDSI